MATYTGTAGNDSWTVVNPGTFTLDGLGGTDTLVLGTSLRSDYRITLAADGGVHIDSISGASQQLHATLYNMEILTFNSGRDVLNLANYFGSSAPPTVTTISDNVPGVANGNVTYNLAFSEAVTGLTASDFLVSNGTVLSVSGSGSNYAVVVAPAPGVEGNLYLTLRSAAVTDSAGNPSATASAAPQPIDTLAPSLAAISPSNGAASVALGSNIDFTFSEAIQKGTGTIVIRSADGSTVASYDIASSPNLTISGRTLTVNPSGDLPASSTLTITLGAGAVKDLVGNPLSTATTTSLTTQPDPLFTGGSGNDTFTATPGHHLVNGGGGIDTLAVAQPHTAFTVAHPGSDYTLTARDGSSSFDMVSTERIRFTDLNLALDLDGHAGQTAELIGAVFGATAVANATYVGIGLGLLDGGTSEEAVAQMALDAALGSNPSHKAVVDLLYQNVMGSAPTPAMEAYFVGLLDNHSFSPAALAVMAAGTAENQLHIGLVGLADSGLPYLGG